MDLANREIVGWSLKEHMKTSMLIQAIDSAVKKKFLEKTNQLIFHYASNTFRKYLKDIGSVSSMSSKGNCYDNAVSESFFSTLKREEINRKKYRNIEEARISLFDYIEIFYNQQRAHSALKYNSPAEVTV